MHVAMNRSLGCPALIVKKIVLAVRLWLRDVQLAQQLQETASMAQHCAHAHALHAVQQALKRCCLLPALSQGLVHQCMKGEIQMDCSNLKMEMNLEYTEGNSWVYKDLVIDFDHEHVHAFAEEALGQALPEA